jgi:energy-converting hydrogenase Eha subunit F
MHWAFARMIERVRKASKLVIKVQPHLLRHAIPKIWKSLPNANKILAIFTIALAIIAFLALREAQNTAQRQLRAYVYVNPQSAFHIDGQGTLQVYSVVGNSGQTPALIQRERHIEKLTPSHSCRIRSISTSPIEIIRFFSGLVLNQNM